MAELLNFLYGTQANYDLIEEYDPNSLYFTTDTLALYKGDKLYNGGVKSVPSLPKTPSLGVLYILTTDWSGQIWTGDSWKVITKPYVEIISGPGTNNDVPTSKAVVDYVTNAIANVTGGTGIFVTEITYNTANNALSVDKGGVKSEVSINGMVHNASYDASNRKVSLPIVKGETVEFTLPADRDLVVKEGKYNPDTEEIWLSIDPAGGYTNTSNVVKIPVNELIDEITTTNSSTITLNYDTTNNTLTANAIISSQPNNALTDNQGLFVDITGKLDKIATSTPNIVVITKADGTIVNSTYTIGTTEFASGENKLAVESAVANYVTAKITETYTNATNYTNTTNTQMKSYVDNAVANVMVWKTF